MVLIANEIEIKLKSLTANRKLLKANPLLTSVTGDHHGVQCVKQIKTKGISTLMKESETYLKTVENI
ncbi:hypothetical protein SFRURICE_006073 [Spodoptera frugiperda]|nr:hypothetical protein SFRURICE_006073 [Spodoptera frugiperda]